MSDHAKRTRSQLSLPEEFGDVHLGVSPLKAARQEWRKSTPVATLNSPDSHVPPNVGLSQSDDGPLLPHRPQKRTSPKPQESSSEIDNERLFKRLKKDHIEDDAPHHAHDLYPEESRVIETAQPIGPFDFSAIGPKDLLSPTGSRQLGASWTKRAQSVPLVSPSAPHRDLGQLMPSPRKAASVPPVEALRFSSLPRTLEPLAEDMVVCNVGTSLTESEREKESTALHISPASKEMGTPLHEKPTSEADTPRSCNDQFPAAGPSSEVTASDVFPVSPLLPLDFCAVTPSASPKGQDSDITPKATAPVPSSPPGGGLIPVPSSDPLSSLTDDPPSPLSALSPLSETDLDPSPTDSEMRASSEPPSRNSQELKPPLFSHIIASKPNDVLSPITRPVTSAASRGRGRRGITKPHSSTRLTRSSATRELGPLHRDSAAGSQSLLIAPGPSSHKQSFSFAMPTSSSLNKNVERANSPQKPWSLPKRQPPKLSSPMKPASSLGSGAPFHHSKHTGLSNLSLALEKLKAPPPSRPATTLGFTRDMDSAASTIGTSKNTPKAKDDSTVRLGNGLPSSTRTAATPLKRAATVGSVASLQPNPGASGSKTTTMIPRPTLPPAAVPVAKISLSSGIIVGKNSFSKSRGFVFGGVGKRRPFEKVSKKSSLPVVEASPVKDSESSRAVNGNPDELPLPSMSHMHPAASASREKDSSQSAVAAPPVGVEPMKLQEVSMRHADIPKADGKVDGNLTDAGEAELLDVWKDASRRASLASQFLQQTLAVLPSTPGPTPGSSKSTAVLRSQSSSQRTRSGLRSGNSSDVAGSRNAPGAPSNGPDVRTTAGASSAMKPSSLKVLKSCTIFVDVRTDDGDDAGGLFVDMLRGLGAKIIGRAGQSCTHIVYKNGLMSTLTKYRLMRDPKPHVVGISWVVECTEQRRRVEEDAFVVDLEGLNIAGNNKRRRSMLPKHISSNMQSHTMAAPSRPSSSLGGNLMSDQSLDGSSVGVDHSLNSSDGFAEDEDDLPPLERARQRRNIFFKR